MEMCLRALYVAAFVFVGIAGQEVEVLVSTGRVVGQKDETAAGTSYYAFKGIRYGEPPERFEPPVAAKPWDGILNATYDKAVCPQLPQSKKEESEDCLFLSVYTPQLNRNESLPVLFWVHGGAFITDDGQYESYGPDFLLDENVVVVSINYRLGALGFLSSGDELLPGNMGVKDVILGLKWAQQNLRVFSGDPTKVTIMGESAGAAIVSYLLMSPVTENKGYYHQAIMDSGSQLTPWSLQRDPKTLYKALLNGAFCRIVAGGARGQLNCLKRKRLSTIRLATLEAEGIVAAVGLNVLNQLGFAPVYEPQNENSAIVDRAYEALLQRRRKLVPLLKGINSEEALFFDKAVPILKPIFVQADVNPLLLVPADMYANRSDARRFVAPAVKNYYFSGQSVALASSAALLRFISDAQFNRPFREYFTLVGDSVPTYCYQFSYAGGMNGVDHKQYPGLGRVGHTEELNYIFKTAQNTAGNYTESDHLTRSRTVRMWANFVKFGSPTPTEDPLLQNVTWPRAFNGGTNIKCIDINENLRVIENPKEDGYQFWKGLYDTYGSPRDTY